MKKRLLFAFMAMCVATSGFALEQGEFVYTPQGRFQITGSNLNANNTFQTMEGWTAIGEGKTLADLFNTNADGLTAGFNSVQSIAATADEGMYFKFEPTSASETYVVSFKMKGAALTTTRVRIPTDYVVNENVVKVEGNSDGVYNGTTDVLLCNTAEELTEEWQTFNYAIIGDGTARTYFISFTSLATSIEVADLQIAPALQFADLRQRDAMVEKMNAYKNCYNWSADVLEDLGYNENLDILNGIGNESGQADLDDQIAICQEILDDFINTNMDDYLPTAEATATTNGAGTPKVDVKFKQWFAKVQKAYTWGDWNCLPSGRGFWEQEAQGAADFGHYAGSYSWAGNSPDDPMGVYMEKTLDPGSYVFAIEGSAAFREAPTGKSWTNNDGLKPAYAVAYIAKVVDGATGDNIVSVVKDLEPVNYTPFIISAKIEEAGTYEIGFKAYCKDAYKEMKNGNVLYIKNASIWGKNENKYNQRQLTYEADVREQITTGRNALNSAEEYLASLNYPWGKSALEPVVDEVEPKIKAYEEMSQDDIIATYQDDYVKSTSEETGYLVYTIYQDAVKDIIAANRTFLAVNDTLNSIQAAIDNAEATLNLRVYDAATGKAELRAAIQKAKDIQAQMKATDYSEENATTIKEANQELADAVEAFKNSIPASDIVEIIGIDFEKGVTKNDETGLYEMEGTNTVMTTSFFLDEDLAEPVTSSKFPFELGFWSNGEKLLPGVLRVGNSTADAAIPARDYGTNILKVTMDWWFGRLSGRKVGFYLYDENDDAVAGLYFEPYDFSIAPNYDSFSLNPLGSFFVANTAGDAAACADNNKTHLECILDYGEKSMYLTSTTPNGSTTSDKVSFNGLVPVKFTLQSNYNYAEARRCWFDNLKLEQITAGEPSGILTLKADVKDNAVYTINGVRVASPTQKGIYIVNGKKTVIK